MLLCCYCWCNCERFSVDALVMFCTRYAFFFFSLFSLIFCQNYSGINLHNDAAPWPSGKSVRLGSW